MNTRTISTPMKINTQQVHPMVTHLLNRLCVNRLLFSSFLTILFCFIFLFGFGFGFGSIFTLYFLSNINAKKKNLAQFICHFDMQQVATSISSFARSIILLHSFTPNSSEFAFASPSPHIYMHKYIHHSRHAYMLHTSNRFTIFRNKWSAHQATGRSIELAIFLSLTLPYNVYRFHSDILCEHIIPSLHPAQTENPLRLHVTLSIVAH